MALIQESPVRLISYDDSPFIKFDNTEQTILPIIKELIDELTIYITVCMNNRNKAIELQSEYYKMDEVYNNFFDIWIKEISNNKDNKSKIK